MRVLEANTAPRRSAVSPPRTRFYWSARRGSTPPAGKPPAGYSLGVAGLRCRRVHPRPGLLLAPAQIRAQRASASRLSRAARSACCTGVIRGPSLIGRSVHGAARLVNRRRLVYLPRGLIRVRTRRSARCRSSVVEHSRLVRERSWVRYPPAAPLQPLKIITFFALPRKASASRKARTCAEHGTKSVANAWQIVVDVPQKFMALHHHEHATEQRIFRSR